MREFAELIKNRIKEKISKIRSDKELMSKLYIITLASALLVLAVVVRGPEQRGKVLNDTSGNAVEIERYSTNTSETYDFEISIKDGEELIVKNLRLTIHAIRDGVDESVLGTEISRADEIEAALDSAISEIEYSKAERIRLPDELSDGSKISWKRLDKKDYTAALLIPAIYLALIIFVIRYSGEKGSNDEKMRRNSIIRGLPRFCNQLHLMMNAGMILSDAFELISANYGKGIGDDEGEGNSDYFERELARMRMKYPDRRKSSASIINEFAVKNDVKEMIRIATILTENEKRGSDVIESLSRESRYLWDERKIVARESGKMIDTKMSYPLGILLILLIVITMAPAMLSM